MKALNACTELSLDIQLKVLQALPSLVQNYSDDLRGELLASALQVCAALQGAKVSTVSAVAAATFQQLATSVFDRLADEDAHAADVPTTSEVEIDEVAIALRPAAFDAYRVFRDLLLAAEGRKTKFVQLTSMTKEASLELISSCMEAKPQLLEKHDELGSIVRSSLMPLVTTSILEKTGFPMMVRYIRILSVIIIRHFATFTAECEVAMGLLPQALEADASPLWKRALLMEVLRDMFAENHLLVVAYMAFDQAENGKPVIQDLMASLVRLSTEKPAAIGLGLQSTMPVGPSSHRENASEQFALESGMAGMLGSFGVTETNFQGISTQWSIPRNPCTELLDKSEAPSLPETYLYSLVLDCLNGLSENLAKIVLPLSVQQERSKTKQAKDHADANGHDNGEHTTRIHRSLSFRKRAVPLNPLELEHDTTAARVRAVASFIETCWPAVLATSSTFLNAAMDDGHYRALIKSYQRFAQVAGLLRLDTPRDALMTTLGKAAVPPQVLSAATSYVIRSPTVECPRVFSNPRSLLSVDSLVSQASSLSTDKDRRSSVDQVRVILTVRNLLCLRALLNLAIALGPTLGDAFGVVMDVVKQADIVLSASGPQQAARSGGILSQKSSDSPAIVQAFSAEVSAVESAASRLLESTADYPNEAFLAVLDTFCRMLHGRAPTASMSLIMEEPRTPSSPRIQQRTFSGLPGTSSFAEMQSRDYQFILPKLGTLAALNVPRFVTDGPAESGWLQLTDEVLAVAVTNSSPVNARRAAADLLCKLAAECINEVSQEAAEERLVTQRRALALLLRVINDIYDEEGELTNVDLEVQSHVINALRSLLERSGDSIVAGWEKIMAIISSVFESDNAVTTAADDGPTKIDWRQVSNEFISLRLGRDAFAAVELLCSDFLSLVPTSIIPALIELLSRFMSQPEDLNLSLTAITVTWNISDHLFDKSFGETVGILSNSGDDSPALEQRLAESAEQSKPAQWLLLLLKLRQIVQKGQREAGKAAFQTICSICKNHGGHLPATAWDLLLRHILIGVIADDAESADWSENALTALILDGTSEIVAQHIELVGSTSLLHEVWSFLVQNLDRMLVRKDLETGSAVFRALAKILAQISRPSAAWDGPTNQASMLWSRRVPTDFSAKQPSETNQDAFCSYADLATQLIRLTERRMSEQQAESVVVNLSKCIQLSDVSFRGTDTHALTALQTQVMDLFKMLRTDVRLVPSNLIATAAEFSKLPISAAVHGQAQNKPSFVALAGESIAWLQELLSRNISNDEILHSGALRRGVTCLADLIEEKYRFKVEYKGSMLWQRATVAAVALSQPVLAVTEQLEARDETRIFLWKEYVRITCNVVQANGLDSFKSLARIHSDEEGDIDAFGKLRAVLVPRLGDGMLPDEIRDIYSRSLMEASIVHATERGEVPGAERSYLENVERIRRGRVKSIQSSQRERMCYECFSELTALSSQNDASAERRGLARASASPLVLRLAIPIRAYIADQPLRGRMPQPVSELHELLYCFEKINDLKLDPEALQADARAGGLRGGNAYLRFLYPLLAQAVRVAGDKRCGSEEVLEPLQGLLQAIEPWSE